MSNVRNDILLDRARELCEYWAGTMWERLIQQDIKNSDMEALAYHISEAAKEQAIQEDYPVVEQPNMRPALPHITSLSKQSKEWQPQPSDPDYNKYWGYSGYDE